MVGEVPTIWILFIFKPKKKLHLQSPLAGLDERGSTRQIACGALLRYRVQAIYKLYTYPMVRLGFFQAKTCLPMHDAKVGILTLRSRLSTPQDKRHSSARLLTVFPHLGCV